MHLLQNYSIRCDLNADIHGNYTETQNRILPRCWLPINKIELDAETIEPNDCCENFK